MRVTAELVQLPDLDRLMQQGLRIFATGLPLSSLRLAEPWCGMRLAGGAYLPRAISYTMSWWREHMSSC